MALTRDFKETILARARRDARFSEALFTEAINAYLAGDTAEGKAILRDLVNATVGFEGLAAAIESLASGFAAGTEDMKEGAAAFGQKRRPKYTGR